MIQDQFKVTGDVKVQHYDKDYKLLQEFDVKNLVVNSGINFVIDRMFSNAAVPMSHMAIGTTFSSPVPTDIALGNEVGRVTFTSSTVSGNQITFVGGFGAGVGTGTITEAGIFNAASDGTMLNRVAFGSVNKDSLDTIIITWTLTLG